MSLRNAVDYNFVPRKGGLAGAIGTIAGGARMKGGPSLNSQTGEVDYAPYAPSHPGVDKWLMGGRTADSAAARNAAIMQYMLEQQVKGKQDRSTVKEQGNQVRLTDAEKAKLESALGKEKSDQMIGQIEVQQNADVMGKKGLIYNKANKRVADQVLTDPSIRSEALQTDLTNKYLTAPGTSESFIKGQQAASLAPHYKNMKDSVLTTPSDSISTFDPGLYGGQPGQVIGPSVEQGLVEGPATELGGGLSIPGKSYPIRRVNPGQVKVPANPELLNQAEQQGAVNPMPGVDNSGAGSVGGAPWNNAQTIMQLLQLRSQMGGY